MIEAKDILLVVIAFCALWFTAFLCWFIWQIVSILRNVNQTMADAREAIHKIESSISSLVEKAEKLTPSMGTILKSGGKVVEHIIRKKKIKEDEN